MSGGTALAARVPQYGSHFSWHVANVLKCDCKDISKSVAPLPPSPPPFAPLLGMYLLVSKPSLSCPEVAMALSLFFLAAAFSLDKSFCAHCCHHCWILSRVWRRRGGNGVAEVGFRGFRKAGSPAPGEPSPGGPPSSSGAAWTYSHSKDS